MSAHEINSSQQSYKQDPSPLSSPPVFKVRLSERYRKKIYENEETHKAFLQKQNVRKRTAYSLMSEEDRQKHRDSCRKHQQSYRERKKAAALVLGSQKSTTDKHLIKHDNQISGGGKKSRAEYMRNYRQCMSSQKRAAINRKRMERYYNPSPLSWPPVFKVRLSERYRKKIYENEETHKAILQKQNVRKQTAYSLMSEEDRQKHRDSCRKHQQSYRDRKKAAALVLGSQKSTTDKHLIKHDKQISGGGKKSRAEYMRNYRQRMSSQKRAAINRKRMERYYSNTTSSQRAKLKTEKETDSDTK